MFERAARNLTVAALLGQGGCGATPVAPARLPTAGQTPSTACVDSASKLQAAAAFADALAVCVAGSTPSCWRIDRATGHAAPGPEVVDSAPTLVAPDFTVTSSPRELAVCEQDGARCRTIDVASDDDVSQVQAVATRELAFVIRDDGRGDLYSIGANKKLRTIAWAFDDYTCAAPALLGETLYVAASICGGQTGRGVLFKLTGARLAVVGDDDFGAFGTPPVQLATSRWAFLEETAQRVVAHDTLSGARVHDVTLANLWRDRGKAIEAGATWLRRTPASTEVALFGDGAHIGQAAVVDLSSGQVREFHLPMCAAR